jgi:capsular exopolysaccharide synthesis family protein
VAAEVDRQILELKMQAFEELIAKEQAEVPEAKLDQAVDSQSSIVAMKNALLEKKDRLKEYERTLVRGNQDRLYVTLQEEIRVDEENLQKTRSELRDSVREEIAAKMGNEHKDALARGRAELDSARLMERLLRERNDALKKDVQEATGDTLQLEFKQAELARAEQVFTIIADRAIKLRTEQRAPSRVMCLLKADPPVAPVEWLPFKRMAVAGVGGMGLLLLLAMAWEWFAHRVSDSQQIELHARLPVLGEITRLPVSAGVRRRSLSGRAGRDLGMFEESIDSLRTSLVLSKPQDMQVLAITSASNSEGKTSVALQLAVSIARSTGQRVLLIDADMRSPDIHELLEIRHSPGLAEVLGHKCVLQEAIVTEWSKFVHVIPAGKLTTSPHKLLGNGALKTLLDEVRGDYRYVVIDTPPILAASEALVLAKAADACLFCAMRDVSRIDRIRRSCDRLAAAGANPIGVVLSGISIREYSHEYGSYYGFSKHESVHETAGTAVDG